MPDNIDSVLFKDLAAADPIDVCHRAQCDYDEKNRMYTVSVWGEDYCIYPFDTKLERIAGNLPVPSDYFGIFIINYLLQSKAIEPSVEWISEKDIPGGTTFFRGPHEIPTRLITSRYSSDIPAFKDTCTTFGGKPLDMAEASYFFDITPRIPIAVLFWDGDDEFPAEAKVLFDKTIIKQLALDIVFALAVDVCSRFARA